MKTISFLTLCAMLVALCVPADAQQPKKVPLLGYLSGGDAAGESTRAEAIRQALREGGYVEGNFWIFNYFRFRIAGAAQHKLVVGGKLLFCSRKKPFSDALILASEKRATKEEGPQSKRR
jgi:hypothetical protein